jgi:UDP-3-O-[3-hydroxymyristoyl] glucosamine N-acyltransferase
MSQVLELAPPSPVFHVDIHPTAVVDKSATIGTARIGAGSYVGQRKLEKMQSYILM